MSIAILATEDNERKRSETRAVSLARCEGVSIVYHSEASWEVDYVLKDLCAEISSVATCVFVTTEELLAYRPAVESQKTVLVVSTNKITAAQLATVLSRVVPRAVILLSDEYGTKPEFHTLLGAPAATAVVLRQHWFASYEPKPNIRQMPLGYKTGFRPPASASARPSERELAWSFTGCMRPGREEMISAFREAFQPQQFAVDLTGAAPAEEMAATLARSTFAPNPRGSVRLDCFRFYEAILCGAVPVVAGSDEELRETFSFGGTPPPFVSAASWPAAASACKALLAPESRTALERLQQSCVLWLKSQTALAQGLVARAVLGEEPI